MKRTSLGRALAGLLLTVAAVPGFAQTKSVEVPAARQLGAAQLYDGTQSPPAPLGVASAPLTTTGSPGSAGDATIVTGGNAETLFSGATPANGFEICNPDPANDLWVSDSTTAAANGQGSQIAPHGGGCYDTPSGYRPVGPVSVYGGVTGQKISARRW
ncbi:MAG: hypothetical protein JO038_01370 [Alphaproteobacteria bacterium]|nr:hypothetical protein [Alphaproteobacteria bacterium]